MTQVQPRGWIDWQSALLSAWMPVMAACAFFYLAISFADDDPPQAVVLATLALIPLELIRNLVLGALSGSFKASKSRLDALYVFFVSILCMAGIFILLGVRENGIVATLKFLIDPDAWKILGVPMLIMVVDGVINILTFRGNPDRQARLLDTLSNDLGKWLGLLVARVPVALGIPYLLLIWAKSDGYLFAAWVPDPGLNLFREVGWSYAGCYFLGKAILIVHVHTARFARTGRGLLDVPWINWVMGEPQRGDAHSLEELPTRSRVKSVLAFEEDVIRAVKEKSEARGKG